MRPEIPPDLEKLEARFHRAPRSALGESRASPGAPADAYPASECLLPSEYEHLEDLSPNRRAHAESCDFCRMALLEIEEGDLPFEELGKEAVIAHSALVAAAEEHEPTMEYDGASSNRAGRRIFGPVLAFATSLAPAALVLLLAGVGVTLLRERQGAAQAYGINLPDDPDLRIARMNLDDPEKRGPAFLEIGTFYMRKGQPVQALAAAQWAFTDSSSDSAVRDDALALRQKALEALISAGRVEEKK